MSITYSKLSARPKAFHRMTGVNTQEFKKIIEKCRSLWQKNIIESRKLSGRPHGLLDIENHLLCLLLYYRCYTTQIYLGYLFDVDESCICRSIKRLEPILAKVVAIKKDRSLTQEQLDKCEGKALLGH